MTSEKINEFVAYKNSFEGFKAQWTNCHGRKDWRFEQVFGDVSMEEAYQIWLERNSINAKRYEKIKALESHFRALGYTPERSQKSFSVYFYVHGKKYRFSDHVHPSGSMTTESCFDFSANPELIDSVDFDSFTPNF